MHAKRQVSFAQIFSLLLLFLLGSMAGSLVLLQETTMLFANQADEHPDFTAAQQAIHVYKHTMLIEFAAVAVSLAFALFFGYLYEVWSRRSVLILSFVLLGISML